MRWHGIVGAAAVLTCASIATADAPVASAAEQKRVGVEVGVLRCHTVEGTRLNLLIHSSVRLDCVFETAQGSERYVGETGVGLGLDINWKRREDIAFAVISGTREFGVGDHSLAGRYLGGKASVTAGVGVGAQAFVGIGPNSVSLQPLGIETSEGLGLAGGLAYLSLEAPAAGAHRPAD